MIKIQDNTATLDKVTTKKVGKGEEKVLLLVMTFSAITSAKGVVPDLLGSPDLVFWRANEDSDPLFLGLKNFASNSRVDHADLSFGGIQFEKSVKLDKWIIVPRPHLIIDVKFNASIADPSKEQVLGAMDKLEKSGRLEVEGALDLLDQMEGDTETN